VHIYVNHQESEREREKYLLRLVYYSFVVIESKQYWMMVGELLDHYQYDDLYKREI
jgi:hypothetical protein